MLARIRSRTRCPRFRSWLAIAAFADAAGAKGFAVCTIGVGGLTVDFAGDADLLGAGTFNEVIFKVLPPRNSDRPRAAPLPDPSRRTAAFPSRPPRRSPSAAWQDSSPGLSPARLSLL